MIIRDICLLRSTLATVALLLLTSTFGLAQGFDALIVGGGPTPESNQVAIENNVRYLLKLLPVGAGRTVLFADGDPVAKTVLFERKAKELSPAERVLALLLEGPEAWRPSTLQFRAPTIPKIDGAAKRGPIDAAIDRLRAGSAADPLLMYFTGHGSANTRRNLDNNVFDLWGEQLSVQELSRSLSVLPSERPITLVMVQCYSGSFGNLLFEGGDPTANAVERDLAGFFATVKEKMAAGCTPAVDEREYRDFSTYFFAALTGKDRVGRSVTGVDYNRDGRVGMDEAFCYTLINNASIDLPVCTSDVFLRRFVTTADDVSFRTPYADVKEWATPAQRNALNQLSASAGLTGEDRIQNAWMRFRDRSEDRRRAVSLEAARRGFMVAREEDRNALFARWPDVKDPQSRGYVAAKSEALTWLRRRSQEGSYQSLFDAEKKLMDEEQAAYARELSEARMIRFVRLAKTVILTHILRSGTDESLKRRFEKLVKAEQRSLLPWRGAAPSTAGN